MANVSEGTLLSGGDLENLIEDALQQARAAGADQAEVSASHDVGLSATARLGEVESLEYTNDRGLWVTVYKNGCKGSANTSDMAPAAIQETVRKACSFASCTASDEHAGLADADRMYSGAGNAVLDLDHPWSIDAQQAIELAIACEAAALSYDKRITNSEGGTVTTNRGLEAYGNSHGFLESFSKSRHDIMCSVLGEHNGEMQRNYHYTSARDPKDLEAAEQVGEEAARRTVARLGARKLKTTRAPVLYMPELARGFLRHAVRAASGGAQYRRASFLLDAAGEQVFPAFLQIEQRPHLRKAMASTFYDSEGVATADRHLIRDGRLEGYVLSSYSARRLGLASTGNAGGTQNLVVQPNAGDQQELLAAMGTGLLVEELIGQGVNGVTGDYSRGAVGHWVENGERQYPVHEVTIAGNLRDLYQRIALLGNDLDQRSGTHCGSLLVSEMTIAGA